MTTAEAMGSPRGTASAVLLGVVSMRNRCSLRSADENDDPNNEPNEFEDCHDTEVCAGLSGECSNVRLRGVTERTSSHAARTALPREVAARWQRPEFAILEGCAAFGTYDYLRHGLLQRDAQDESSAIPINAIELLSNSLPLFTSASAQS